MRVRYDGPSGAVNRDVGRHTDQGDRLIPGREYDVPAKIAERLMDSSPHWSKVTAPKKAPVMPVAVSTQEVTDGTP
jgi:hypothetical protein